MEDLLVPVKSSTIARGNDEDFLAPIGSDEGSEPEVALESLNDAITVLKSQPDLAALKKTLSWLESRFGKDDASNSKLPGSKSAHVVFILVSDIVPAYWSILKDAHISSHIKVRNSLIRCLNTVTGIGTITNRLNLLLRDQQGQAQPGKSSNVGEVADLVNLLQQILSSGNHIHDVWHDLTLSILNPNKRSLLWKEAISLLAAGRILSSAAQAEDFIRGSSSKVEEGCWLAKGPKYATWLGTNIESMITHSPADSEESRKAASQVLSKSLILGYIDNVVRAAFSGLITGDDRNLSLYRQTLGTLTPNEQKNILHSLFRILSNRLQPFDKNLSEVDMDVGRVKVLQGVAALIASLIADSPGLSEELCRWLTSSDSVGVGQGTALLRAVIATLSQDQEQLKRVFERALGFFGDKLYIKHTPILQQEVNTQVLLIVAGYLHRSDSAYVSLQSRSSTYINAISNRLSASSPRATVLGMLVGTAISELVDAEGKRMKFSAEEIDLADGKWYRNLVTIQDAVGSIEDLKFTSSLAKKLPAAETRRRRANRQTEKSSTKTEAASRIVAIEEVDDESESEDDDLVVYEKPDSDASDEDEDPTLVQRDKPTAPVYIRDLVAGLRDSENFDRHQLAVRHASGLIRRKASFGSEVSEHIEELATLLVGLGDKYNMENFQQLRLRGMIAVLIVQPLKMGQWFSRTFFNGDYSVGQRASVLTTLGLGARELAGLEKEDTSLTGVDRTPKNTFPSKMLPEKLHNIYALEGRPVDAISEQLEKSMLKPMAVHAAEQLAGPSALKVRTFSSRMAVEKKRERPIANSLAKNVAEGFLFPLMGLWRTHAQAYGDRTVHSSPFLLTLYLKTLSLILHASGSSTLSLPQMTAEFWDLLLSLRSRAGDLPVLEALLFALLTLLDINENNQRGIAEAHGRELLETQEWVQTVFEKVGGGSEEGERVRMLAAGVLTRTREVVEKQQRVLMGSMADYM